MDHSIAVARDESAARRQMRKGTKSCTECRRRKIRCIYNPGNSQVCSRCSMRGLRCMSQSQLAPNDAESEKKTLRDRVTRLETLMAALLTDKPSQRTSEGGAAIQSDQESDLSDFSDDEEFAEQRGLKAPLLSLLGPDEGPEVAADRTPASTEYQQNTNPPTHSNTRSTTEFSPQTTADSNLGVSHHQAWKRSKKTQICETLRATLPPFDQMLDTLRHSGGWWLYWIEKTFGGTKIAEPLVEYAARVYTSDTPEELGMLTAAYGRTVCEKHRRYLVAVEELVVSRYDFGVSILGLECLLLLAKCYLDVGQPKRAWLTYRRGLTFAQFMNLPRKLSLSPEFGCIWWSFYLGDRFVSLLLGYPHGGDSAHLSIDMEAPTEEPSVITMRFTIQCGKVAGRIIDRNQMAQEAPLSITIQMEEEMDSISASMPPIWWDLSLMIAGGDMSESEIRQRLLIQANFFHIRMYLHLPFMLKPRSASRYEHTRKVCTESAYELLRRYHFLRSDVNGHDYFDCMTNDFVGFTAAVVLLIGMKRNGELEETARTTFENDSWDLIRSVMSTYEKLSTQRGSLLATQCLNALQLLLQISDNNYDIGVVKEAVKISIPYFGIISIAHASGGSQRPSQPLAFSPEIDDKGSNVAVLRSIDDRLYTEHDIFMERETAIADALQENIINDFAVDVDSTWWSEPLMDIDGNWELFNNF